MVKNRSENVAQKVNYRRLEIFQKAARSKSMISPQAPELNKKKSKQQDFG